MSTQKEPFIVDVAHPLIVGVQEVKGVVFGRGENFSGVGNFGVLPEAPALPANRLDFALNRAGITALLGKLNDDELRMFRDRLRGILARVQAASEVRSLLAQVARESLLETEEAE